MPKARSKLSIGRASCDSRRSSSFSRPSSSSRARTTTPSRTARIREVCAPSAESPARPYTSPATARSSTPTSAARADELSVHAAGQRNAPKGAASARRRVRLAGASSRTILTARSVAARSRTAASLDRRFAVRSASRIENEQACHRRVRRGLELAALGSRDCGTHRRVARRGVAALHAPRTVVVADPSRAASLGRSRNTAADPRGRGARRRATRCRAGTARREARRRPRGMPRAGLDRLRGDRAERLVSVLDADARAFSFPMIRRPLGSLRAAITADAASHGEAIDYLARPTRRRRSKTTASCAHDA